MSGMTVFAPGKLRGIIRALAPRFFLPSEFPTRQPDPDAQHLLEAAAGLPADALAHFAVQLKSAEIEALILWLPHDEKYGPAFIADILKFRANNRFFELLWPFFQYYYENRTVAEATKSILSNLPEAPDGPATLDSGPDAPDGTAAVRNLRLFSFTDGFAALLEKLLACGAPLGVFAAEEALLADSPLAERLFASYFCVCGKDGFLLNEKRLHRLLAALPRGDVDRIFLNYLRQLDRLEFLPDVNAAILDRWGEPYKSADWTDKPPELQQKFAEWISYRRLLRHFEKNKLKLRILNSIVPYMRQVRLSGDARFLAADFGEFYIVDDNELSSYSYYVDYELFEKLFNDPEQPGIENFRDQMIKLSNARDFMIDEAEDSFMQLEYEDLGRLYIMDMLAIKLNVTPDLRPSKSILKSKRQKSGM